MEATHLKLDQDIQSISEFRKNAAGFIDRLKNQTRSIVLTQDGKSAAVLVDVGEYQRMVDKLNMMDDLLEAERQIARGEVYTHEPMRKPKKALKIIWLNGSNMDAESHKNGQRFCGLYNTG